MATTAYFNGSTATGENAPTVSSGLESLDLRGVAQHWRENLLGTDRGIGLIGVVTDTVAGTTAGVEAGFNTTAPWPVNWYSQPLAQDVTISGTITANLWAQESSMSANAAVNLWVGYQDAATGAITEIVRSTRTTELGTSSSAANFTTGMTSGSYTGVTVHKGDRLVLRPFFDDAGTMAAGFTCTVWCGGTTSGADGDSFVTFTETFSFDNDYATPGGTQLFLTNTASAVATASVDREAWTSRGAGVQNDVVNSVTGYTDPIQLTDTAGGTVVDWFTRPLTAFTLGGTAIANIRGGSAGAGVQFPRVEIAVVANDGTSPTVWGAWTCDTGFQASEIARSIPVSGADLSVANNQRLRIRLYIDDGNQPMTAGSETFYYAGTSSGASGDTYVILPQTVSEFTGTTTSSVPATRLYRDRFGNYRR